MAVAFLKSLQALEMSGSTGPTARWEVPLTDGVHVIEFEHGTGTGRRVIRYDDRVILNREWMFRLVGEEPFEVQDNKFVIRVEPAPGLKYAYTLSVNGKSFDQFIRGQAKELCVWTAVVGSKELRIILDKNSRNLWINGEQVETQSEFVDAGSELRFEAEGLKGRIECTSSGDRKIGMCYRLLIDDQEILVPDNSRKETPEDNNEAESAG